jgi:hypothetical protein
MAMWRNSLTAVSSVTTRTYLGLVLGFVLSLGGMALTTAVLVAATRPAQAAQEQTQPTRTLHSIRLAKQTAFFASAATTKASKTTHWDRTSFESDAR